MPVKPAKNRAVKKKATSKKTPAKKTVTGQKVTLSTMYAQAKADRNKKIATDGQWRKRIRAGNEKFNDEMKNKFCNEFAKSGRMKASAAAIGISYDCVRAHLMIDPEFQKLFEEAKESYKDKVHKVVEKVALEGVDEPIIGGKFKDRVVATKKVFATNILAMEMKRTNPEYREKTEIDLTMRGGIIAVPAKLSMEEFKEKYGIKTTEEVQSQGGMVLEHNP